jgi:hypothetical protein
MPQELGRHAVDVIREWPNADWELTGGVAYGLARSQLESGKVLVFPRLRLQLLPGEERVLGGKYRDGKAKEISLRDGAVQGADGPPEDLLKLAAMLERFSRLAMALVGRLVPEYVPHMERVRASLRTQEVAGSPAGGRADETRLHVDADPSGTVPGQRLLCVLTNIDPHRAVGEWVVGEPFADFAARFVSRTRAPSRAKLWAIWKLGLTERMRSEYDDRMLQLHDLVKSDPDYQRNAPQSDVRFPAGTTWILFSDQVLHAARRGKCMLEQTIQVDARAIKDRSQSPKDVLERLVGHALV